MSFIRIKKSALLNNLTKFQDICLKNHAELNAVTKVCISRPEIIYLLAEKGAVKCISDSNMDAFLKINRDKADGLIKCLIKTRLSDIKKLPDVPEYAVPDRIFISDYALLEAAERLPENIRPEIVLIAEAGDLKDGMDSESIIEAVKKFPGLNIMGVSANFSCLSGKLPDLSTIKKISALAEYIAGVKKLASPFFSVGGTVIFDLAETGGLEGLVQEIRVGEGIFFGRNSSGNSVLKGFDTDAVEFCGEIIEIAEKNVLPPNGAFGHTALGKNKNNNAVTGLRRRAVLDFGVLGAPETSLECIDGAVFTAGQTYDFTVVDITDSRVPYKTGGFISFRTNYDSAAHLMMNPFIDLLLQEYSK